jgi:hypothetical protein
VTHTPLTLSATIEVSQHLGIDGEQIVINALPMVPVAGLAAFLSCVRFGAPLNLLERSNPEAILDTVPPAHAPKRSHEASKQSLDLPSSNLRRGGHRRRRMAPPTPVGAALALAWAFAVSVSLGSAAAAVSATNPSVRAAIVTAVEKERKVYGGKTPVPAVLVGVWDGSGGS